MNFIKIKAGSFLMGSPESEEGRYDDEKQHKVTIENDFEIMDCPVTQTNWVSIMETDNPSFFKGKDNPIDSVSWDDCQKLIKKLNNMKHGYTYRLPTESEWEYACRASGISTAYYFGDNPKFLDGYAWYFNNSDNKTHPVKQKLPNNFGLYDMHGNVWEWCQDLYENRSYRVLRGGSWDLSAQNLRSARRYGDAPAWRSHHVGFRLVRIKTGDKCIQKQKQEILQKENTRILNHVKNADLISIFTDTMRTINDRLKSSFYVESAIFRDIKNGKIGDMEIENLSLALFVEKNFSQTEIITISKIVDENVLRSLQAEPQENDGINHLALNPLDTGPMACDSREQIIKLIKQIRFKLRKLQGLVK